MACSERPDRDCESSLPPNHPWALSAAWPALSAVAAVTLCISCGSPPDPYKEAVKLANDASKMMMKEEYAGAREKLLVASAKRPQCFEYHMGIALCSVRLRDSDTAVDHYAKAEELLAPEAETTPRRVMDYVMVLICQNKDKEAAAALAKARDKFGGDPSVKRLSEGYNDLLTSWATFRLNPRARPR